MIAIADDGVRLHYSDVGMGLPVLLLHAFPLNGDSFAAQVSALSGKYRFIVPDHRGFGRSGAAQGVTEMSRLARDALAILDALDVRSAVVGGVSMGGYASMALAREDPGRVQALVLADTQALADDEAAKQRREETARLVLERGMDALVDSMLPRLLAPEAKPEVRTEVERMIRSNSPAGAAAALRGMALRPDSQEILARFGNPALVIVGEQDTLTPPERAKQMKDLLQSAELVTIAGAGHLSNMEAPETFNRALDSFLSRLSRRLSSH